MLFFSPALHAQVDFSVEVEFLQQELFQQVMKDKSGRRSTDQLVKVHLKGGEEKWILVHVEVQGDNEKDFAERMFQYFYRIYDRFSKKIVTLAVMTSPHRSENPAVFQYDYFGTKLHYAYNNCRLIDYDYPELEHSDKLFSKIVLAAKYRNDTKEDTEKRYTFKEKLMRELIKNNRYLDVEIQAAIYFIDYLLRLPEELTHKLYNTLTPIIQEEGNDMVQFNSGEWGPTMEAVFAKLRENAERVGLEQGIERGIEQGLERGIEKGLEQGVKKVVIEMLKEGAPIDFIARVTHLEQDQIERLRETLQ